MFTVCPKCALTLVVTAADLRVAQGFVRCGRCSNVFNALARLSDERQATTQNPVLPESGTASHPTPDTSATQRSRTSQDLSATARTRLLPDPSLTGRTRTQEDPRSRLPKDTSATGRTRSPVDPSATGQTRAPADTSATGRVRAPEDTSATGRIRTNTDTSATGRVRAPADTSTTSRTKQPAAAAPTQQPADSMRIPAPAADPSFTANLRKPAAPAADPDAIPDNALEFNADADLNQVFVEQQPSPQFKAATGTFKSLRQEAAESARAPQAPSQFDPVDTRVDVEIDPDVLAAMAHMSSTRLEKLELERAAVEEPEEAAAEVASDEHNAPDESTAGADTHSQRALEPAGPEPAEPEQSRQEQAAAPIADRARARAEASRPLSLETTEAIRAALAPRKRSKADEEPASEPTAYGRLWIAGTVALVLLLLLQVVHHYRNELAATATLNGPLTSVYATLGIPLVPSWDLAAYEVRQLGASTAADAPGQIMVRASVKNGAHQSQPLPLLRVTLQDRFGNRIAARDVPPQSYLSKAIPRSAQLSAGQRIDAEMAFVDPGSNAVGFEIDACLPTDGGGITCANDLAH